MTSYAVDGLPLLDDESRRHRGACNATLNALSQTQDAREECDMADAQEASRESVVSEAFDLADEVVREYRRRCRPKPKPDLPHRLADDEARIAAWVASPFDHSVDEIAAVAKLKENPTPRTIGEMVEALGLRRTTLESLVRRGFLVPVSEAGDAA